MIKYLLFTISLFVSILAQGQFAGQFDLLMSQEYQNGNQRIDTLQYTFGEEKTALIIKARGNQPDLKLVFSKTDSTITGLFENNGKKGGYILPMNDKYWPAMETAYRDYGTGPRTQLNWSGEQKEIEGFKCQELLCGDENFEGVLWMTSEIPLTLLQVLAYSFVGAGEDTSELDWLNQCGVQSFTLLAEIEDKKRNSTVTLQIYNLMETFNDSIFSTEGYSLEDMREKE